MGKAHIHLVEKYQQGDHQGYGEGNLTLPRVKDQEGKMECLQVLKPRHQTSCQANIP